MSPPLSISAAKAVAARAIALGLLQPPPPATCTVESLMTQKASANRRARKQLSAHETRLTIREARERTICIKCRAAPAIFYAERNSYGVHCEACAKLASAATMARKHSDPLYPAKHPRI